MPLKLLTDFDGVWTDQAEEARAVRDGLVAVVARQLRVEPRVADADFDDFLGRTLADPGANGWTPPGEASPGRLTAFVDEDPVLATISVAGWLDRGAVHPRADAWRKAARDAGHATVSALATAHFGPAMRRHREEGGHALVDGARAALEALWSADVDVVVVSNSRTDKLEALFRAAGIDPEPRPALRLVGDARKWQLGPGAERARVADREIPLDRPAYRALLEREAPDVVVGDVYSLDLALPAALRTGGHLRPAPRLALRRHRHTPVWSLDARRAGQLDHVFDDVTELPALALSR